MNQFAPIAYVGYGWNIWLRKPPKATAQSHPKGKADPIWDTAIQPKTKSEVKPISKAPFGTAPTLSALGTFLNHLEEIEAIQKTQRLEVATIREELAMHGIKSTSLDEPLLTEDGELEAANIAEHHLRWAPYRFGAMDPDETALLRRIEWEKYIFRCGPAEHVYATMAPDGTRSLGTEAKWLTHDRIAEFAPAIRAMVADRPIEDVVAAQDRANHYGVNLRALIRSLMTDDELVAFDDEQNPARKRYFDVADTEDRTAWDIPHRETITRDGEWANADEQAQVGATELGLHTYDRETGFAGDTEDALVGFVTHETIHLREDFEPSEYALWPEERGE